MDFISYTEKLNEHLNNSNSIEIVLGIMQKTYSIITLGCKVNQYESDAIADRLNNVGWIQAKNLTDVDCYIINTCTVTQKASMQSRQEIRQAIRTHPNAIIVVTGCYAQTEPTAIQSIDGVHMIVGNTDKHRIPELILKSSDIHLPHLLVQNIFCEKQLNHPYLTAFGIRTRPFVKIQDGCNAYCTYCIVPYARGRSRSLHPDGVLNCLMAIGDTGYKEAVLTGIHLGAYGLDLDPPINLVDLLKLIHDRRLINRIRLSSIEPKEISNELIQLISNTDKICHHFHIPLQSGDNEILKRMNRPYDRQYFYDLVHTIHEQIPDAAIGVDILIGFPGETDQAFEQTYSLIEQLPVTYLHVFPFSPRKGTVAYDYDQKVPVSVIKKRCAHMRLLGNRKKNIFYRKQLGKIVHVLIEDAANESQKFVKGISSNYIPVFLTGDYIKLKNTIVPIQIEEVRDNHQVFGRIQPHLSLSLF